MKFRLKCLLTLSLLSGAAFASSSGNPDLPEIRVYAYDTLNAPGGLLARAIPAFEKGCKCKVRVLASGDSGHVLARLQIDASRGKPSAHVIVGLDQNSWLRAKPWIEPWGKWRPKGYSEIPAHLRVGTPGDGFLPLDYGVFAFIADTQWMTKGENAIPGNLPVRLDDLLQSRWRRNLLLQDPRTSAPGLAFVLFVQKTKQESSRAFWGKLKNQWLTLAPGWDASYGMFLKGEAPLVWSYTTSLAYHREKGDSSGRYKSVFFEEGQPFQVEGAAIVKGAARTEKELRLARQFLEFLVSKETQALIPKTQWMLPVIPGISLPKVFQGLSAPERLVDLQLQEGELEMRLKEWSQAIE